MFSKEIFRRSRREEEPKPLVQYREHLNKLQRVVDISKNNSEYSRAWTGISTLITEVGGWIDQNKAVVSDTKTVEYVETYKNSTGVRRFMANVFSISHPEQSNLRVDVIMPKNFSRIYAIDSFMMQMLGDNYEMRLE